MGALSTPVPATAAEVAVTAGGTAPGCHDCIPLFLIEPLVEILLVKHGLALNVMRILLVRVLLALLALLSARAIRKLLVLRAIVWRWRWRCNDPRHRGWRWVFRGHGSLDPRALPRLR